MATNYNVKMAVDAIAANDKEAILDCGRRFPLATTLLAKLVSKAPNEIAEFASAIPEHVSVRKIESTLKDGVSESEVDEDEAVEEKPAKEEKPKKEKAEKPAKEKKAKKEEAEVENDESDYSSMNAVELFKLCKKRGIKVEPKQKADVYVKALKADDNSNSETPVEDDGDDWDI